MPDLKDALAVFVLLASAVALGVALAAPRWEPKGGYPKPPPVGPGREEGAAKSGTDTPTHPGVPMAVAAVALGDALAVWTLLS